MSMLVAWLDQLAPAEAIRLGGSKMGRLAELASTGAAVPRAFTITVEAFAMHMSRTGLDRVADDALAGLDADDPVALQAVCDQVRAAIATTAVEPSLAAAIVDEYEELCDRCSDLNVPTAVRSSATGEDGADTSFAGIFDTFLGVSGPDRVLLAVQECWASLFSPRATAYRARHGISHRQMPMAVGVVELVHARCSGVAFSLHPVSGKNDRVVVESNWGWGEAVVQGLVTPDHFEVDKADRRVIRRQINDKRVVSAFDFAIGHVTETAMPQRLRERASVDDEELLALVDAVVAIEEHYGYPVDVEWVVSRHRRHGDPVSIVQTRPVTVVEKAAPPAFDPMALANKHIFGRA